MKISGKLLFLSLAGASFFLFACKASIPFTSTPVSTDDNSTSGSPLSKPASDITNPENNSKSGQPVSLHGEFNFSNDIILTYYVEDAVALVDMHGFVTRDQLWEIPVKSQTLGYLKIDKENMSGKYELQLPARPTALFDDVDNDSQSEKGVQVFAVSYWPNLYGDPYSVGDDVSRGWPSYLASVLTDTENQNEIVSGKLVVWAPDDKQSFPSDFGDDGLLFTKDDPADQLPAGYSIVDLDQSPFAISHEEDAELTLYEPNDVAVKDFSDLSYSESFKKMFEILRKEYAFSDIKEKSPDWDAVFSKIEPMVAQAQADRDALAFYAALADFTYAFNDGHVYVNEYNLGGEYFAQKAGGGLGFAIRELDDGEVLVTYVSSFGPARNAGMKVGAVITQFNGLPIAEAISKVKPMSAPNSTALEQRFQQTRYLGRSAIGTSVDVTFKNPGQGPVTTTMKSIDERDSLAVTDGFRNYDPNALPVEFYITNDWVGYVRINSNYDDLNLIIRLFERALSTFEKAGVYGIVIDMRTNSGGSSLGLAGYLIDENIQMSQLEYYSDKTGKFEPDGPRGFVYPNQNRYHFDRMITLVDTSCYSACEIEAYAFSQVPGMIVMGQNPTAGVEAEVARGQFILPEGITLQAPTGRFTLPDGSIFLEGKGVPPTMRIPITAENALSSQDVVLQAAFDEILKP